MSGVKFRLRVYPAILMAVVIIEAIGFMESKGGARWMLFASAS